MASKVFHLNDQPHEVKVGQYVFLFEPEANGAEFASAYALLAQAQSLVSAARDGALSADDMQAVQAAMRSFLMAFMLPETVEAFESAKLPDRVLTGMIEFLAEVYAGGNDPSGSFPAS